MVSNYGLKLLNLIGFFKIFVGLSLYVCENVIVFNAVI